MHNKLQAQALSIDRVSLKLIYEQFNCPDRHIEPSIIDLIDFKEHFRR